MINRYLYFADPATERRYKRVAATASHLPAAPLPTPLSPAAPSPAAPSPVIHFRYKRIVRDRLHYTDDIFCAAGRVVRLLHEESAGLLWWGTQKEKRQAGGTRPDLAVQGRGQVTPLNQAPTPPSRPHPHPNPHIKNTPQSVCAGGPGGARGPAHAGRGHEQRRDVPRAAHPPRRLPGAPPRSPQPLSLPGLSLSLPGLSLSPGSLSPLRDFQVPTCASLSWCAFLSWCAQ